MVSWSSKYTNYWKYWINSWWIARLKPFTTSLMYVYYIEYIVNRPCQVIICLYIRILPIPILCRTEFYVNTLDSLISTPRTLSTLSLRLFILNLHICQLYVILREPSRGWLKPVQLRQFISSPRVSFRGNSTCLKIEVVVNPFNFTRNHLPYVFYVV